MVGVALSINIFAQSGSVSGTVTDGDSGEPLIGASVVVEGTTTGSITDINGQFTISGVSGDVTLEISFVGYEVITKEVSVNGSTDIGSVSIRPEAIGLQEVQVIASFAVDRKTPVAVSTIKGKEIEARVGNQEFPEVLRYTPSIYATKGGGGFGDARINVRGFDQRNTAVMINGIPVNDMENGWVYWSNWAGLSDVSSAIQVQRGLSASKLAVSSVGGTINIVTRAADINKGGAVSLSTGNDGFQKYGISLNSGLLDNGWAFSVQGTRTAGNGYVDGTQFSAWSYFASISKNLGDNHTLVLTGLGAPQWHHQRLQSNFDNITLETYREENEGRKFNDIWGELDGEEFSWRRNFYHKPKIFLNHYWEIGEKSELNTSAYFSLGNGGGTGPRGRGAGFQFDSSPQWRNADGTVRWDDIVDWQQNSPNSGFENEFDTTSFDASVGNYTTSSGNGLIRRASMNYHTWTGILSTFNTDLSSTLNLNVGLDARYYKGEHFRRVENLLGLDAYLARADDNNPSNFITTEDPADFGSFRTDTYKDGGNNVLNYYNDGLVGYVGLFSQLEYSKDALSAFLALSASNQGYKRIDYFNYLADDPERETDWHNMWGGTIKGGANYNINSRNNIYAYGGWLSRQPLFDAVYINFVNDLNEDVKNEDIYSFELGYGYTAPFFNVKANIYSTTWSNRVITQTVENAEEQDILYTFDDVSQNHQGFELEVNASPARILEVRAMASLGNWKYTDDFSTSGVNVDSVGDTRSYESTLALKDEKIGDAAQTTLSFGASLKPFKGFRVNADFIYYDNLFARWQATDDLSDGIVQLPTYSLVDLGVNYQVFTRDNLRISLRGNINNLFDTWYISEMFTNNGDDIYANEGYVGFGRTWNAGIKIQF